MFAQLIVSLVTFQTAVAGQAATPNELADVRSDPAAIAREVSRGEEFWWKRTEQIDAGWELPWIGRVFGAIGRILRDTLEALIEWLRGVRFSFGFFDYQPGATLIWILLLILTVGVSTALFRTYRKWLIHAAPTSPRRAERTLPQAMVLIEEADDAFQNGRHREALRFAFLALLAWLQNQGLLNYDISRTNREYLRDLRHRPELAGAFREAAIPFERAWYGQSSVTSQQAAQMLIRCRRLMDSPRTNE